MNKCYYRVIIITLLLFLLSGCDPSVAPSKTQADVYKLHIKQKYPLSCPVGAGETLSRGTPSNNLILNGDRLPNDTGSIQQITSYINGSSAQFPARLLSWAPGGLTGIGQPLKDRIGCGIDLQFSNEGNVDIKILYVKVRLLETPFFNTARYKLIDICPIRHLETIKCQTGTGGTSADCDVIIHLENKQAGTIFENTFKGIPNCNGQVMNPDDALDMHVTFYSDGPNSNLIYTVSLEITIESQGKQYTEKPDDALGKLVFAKSDQFSCYRLQDNTFQRIVPSADNPALCV